MPLNQEQAALILGVTTRRLRQIEQEGAGPIRDLHGLYPEAAFGEWLKARTAGESGAFVYEVERARLTHEQADKTALENSELRADLVRMSVVESYWAGLGSSLRSKLISIPSKIGALVADPAIRAKITGQSEALVYEALAEIQQDAVPSDIRARHNRARRDDVPVDTEAATEANA